MATDILTTIRLVGLTPGFAVQRESGSRWQLIRLANPEAGIKKSSIKVSTNVGDHRQVLNDETRLRRMGWTRALYEECERVTKEHRERDTDPAEDHLKLLLDAVRYGEDESPKKAPAAPAASVSRRRVNKGTATGSAKSRAGQAQPGMRPDLDPTAPAPVTTIPGVRQIVPEIITPERALELLAKKAPYQRKLRESRRNDLAAAMVRGEWMLNAADPICLDTHGYLANGQHRLEAVLMCMLPQPFYVAYDVDPEAYRVFDRGTKRTTADMLYGAGEKNTHTLASSARLLYLWENVPDPDDWSTHPEVTEKQIFGVIEKHPTLRDSASMGRLGKGLRCSPTAAVFAHYVIGQVMGGDTRLVTNWYRAMEGMRLAHGQPGHALGLFFLKNAPSARRRTELVKRTQRDLDAYLLVQAWNSTARGVTRNAVSWKPGFVISKPIPPVPGKHIFPDELFD